MKISEIIQVLEAAAPRLLQEKYDNSGLLVGDPGSEIEKALVSLDVTEEVVEEAISKGCGLIISHHPVIFDGIKSLTGKNYVERTVIKAIRNDIAIYAIHTNLDNVMHGVNYKIAEVLGIKDPVILCPKSDLLLKLVVFVPQEEAEKVMKAMFVAGAGHIGNYDECSFSQEGTGTFRAGENTDPYVGEKGQRHYEKEARVEVVVPVYRKAAVINAMTAAHPYEEVAYDIYRLENQHSRIGSGMIGELDEAVNTLDFLKRVKEKFGGVVRYTRPVREKVKKIAWCGGSGSFLLANAKAAGADVFLSSDFKYHQFFDAENEIVIADIGHYENEQYTKELIASVIKENFTTFAVLLTETNTNPINYL